jgi:hypothetical protein
VHRSGNGSDDVVLRSGGDAFCYDATSSNIWSFVPRSGTLELWTGSNEVVPTCDVIKTPLPDTVSGIQVAEVLLQSLPTFAYESNGLATGATSSHAAIAAPAPTTPSPPALYRHLHVLSQILEATSSNKSSNDLVVAVLRLIRANVRVILSSGLHLRFAANALPLFGTIATTSVLHKLRDQLDGMADESKKTINDGVKAAARDALSSGFELLYSTWNERLVYIAKLASSSATGNHRSLLRALQDRYRLANVGVLPHVAMLSPGFVDHTILTHESQRAAEEMLVHMTSTSGSSAKSAVSPSVSSTTPSSSDSFGALLLAYVAQLRQINSIPPQENESSGSPQTDPDVLAGTMLARFSTSLFTIAARQLDDIKTSGALNHEMGQLLQWTLSWMSDAMLEEVPHTDVSGLLSSYVRLICALSSRSSSLLDLRASVANVYASRNFIREKQQQAKNGAATGKSNERELWPMVKQVFTDLFYEFASPSPAIRSPPHRGRAYMYRQDLIRFLYTLPFASNATDISSDVRKRQKDELQREVDGMLAEYGARVPSSKPSVNAPADTPGLLKKTPSASKPKKEDITSASSSSDKAITGSDKPSRVSYFSASRISLTGFLRLARRLCIQAPQRVLNRLFLFEHRHTFRPSPLSSSSLPSLTGLTPPAPANATPSGVTIAAAYAARPTYSNMLQSSTMANPSALLEETKLSFSQLLTHLFTPPSATDGNIKGQLEGAVLLDMVPRLLKSQRSWAARSNHDQLTTFLNNFINAVWFFLSPFV